MFSSDIELEPWVITEEGLCPFTSWNLWRLDFSSLLLRTCFRYEGASLLDPLKHAQSSAPAWLWFRLHANARSKRTFLVEWLRDIKLKPALTAYLVRGKRLITSSTFAEYFKKVTTYPNGIKRQLPEEAISGDYCSLATNGCPSTSIEIDALPPLSKPDSFESAPPLLIEFFLRKGIQPKQTIFEQLWNEIIDYPVIPFALEERRAKLAKAYRALDSYIKAHEDNKRNQKKLSESVAAE